MARIKKLTDYAYSPTNPASENAIRGQIDDSIQEVYDASAKKTDTVNLTGNQTIAGVKTFTSNPTVPIPTIETQVSTKGYVDTHKSSGDHDGRYYTETEVNDLLQANKTGDHTGTWQGLNPSATSEAIQSQVDNLEIDKLNISSKATELEAEAGIDDTKYMTPLKTKQAILSLAPEQEYKNVQNLSSTTVGLITWDLPELIDETRTGITLCVATKDITNFDYDTCISDIDIIKHDLGKDVVELSVSITPITQYWVKVFIDYTIAGNIYNSLGVTTTFTTLAGFRYGIKIDKSNPNPDTRIEYILDAVGFTPAKMNFVTGQFDYGSWGNIWFVEDNYPAMIKSDGTEDYKLNPNDYSQKLLGGASDVANASYDGNAMSVIPLVWLKQYELGGYEYIIASDKQYDASYKAYAHTKANGSIMSDLRLAMFRGAENGGKLRSLSGLQPMHTQTADYEITKAKANGALWDTRTWAQRNLINSLLSIISKSDDTQNTFGNGNLGYVATPPYNGVKAAGSLNAQGQFKGYNDNTHQVKVFHIEAWWADQWDRIQGLLNINGAIKVKMTPPYNLTGAGFTNVGKTPAGTTGGYISQSFMSELGRIAHNATATSATYQCDGLWFINTITAMALVGGGCDGSLLCGVSCVLLAYPSGNADWSLGAALSCEGI